MNRRRNSGTSEANSPLDGHCINWWFTTDNAGAVLSWGATVESVIQGTIDGVTGYRVRLTEPAPLDKTVGFGIECTGLPASAPDTSAHYFPGLSGTGTVTVIGIGDQALEFDVYFQSANSVATPETRVSGYLLVDAGAVTPIDAHAG